MTPNTRPSCRLRTRTLRWPKSFGDNKDVSGRHTQEDVRILNVTPLLFPCGGRHEPHVGKISAQSVQMRIRQEISDDILHNRRSSRNFRPCIGKLQHRKQNAKKGRQRSVKTPTSLYFVWATMLTSIKTGRLILYLIHIHTVYLIWISETYLDLVLSV